MRNRRIVGVLAVMILVITFSTWAKVISPRPFFLDRDVTFNGAAVPRGMYSLTVSSNGSSVRATLMKDGVFVATAHGTWVKHGVKYPENAVLLRVNSDGTRSLTEIRLAGSTKTIVLDNETSVLRVGPAPHETRSTAPNGTAN